mgnify:CR=1 FL=1
MLDLYKLEIFQKVAGEGSISKAAERLLLTQPAVSQHVRDLEGALGVELFSRGRRGVTLTPAGETLLDYTRCILRMVTEAESAVANVQELSQGQIRIGATPGASTYLLPEWVQSFHDRFPSLKVLLSTDETDAIADAIGAGTLDIGIVEGDRIRSERASSLHLQAIESFVVVGPGHPWWERGEISLEMLDNQPFLATSQGSQSRQWLDNNLAQHQVQVHVVAEYDNMEAIKRSVRAGMGIAILPGCAIWQEQEAGTLRALAIQGALIERTLKLVWAKALPFKPITRAFLAHLAEWYPHLGKIIPPGSNLDLKLPRPLQMARPESFNCSG